MKITDKTCFKCGAVKPITDFYVHPAMGDSRMNKCKECTRADVQRNYRANVEHYKEYEKKRAMLPHRVALRDKYQKSEPGKQAIRRAHKRYAESNPVKRRAQVAACNAVRDGRLVRKPCEICGRTAQAHHDDYSKPLDVRWLCSAHHAEWHKHNTPVCPDQEQAA